MKTTRRPNARMQTHDGSNPTASREASEVDQLQLAPGAGCWQVFGLTSAPDESGFLLPIASRPSALPFEERGSTSATVGVVLAYRCGAAPALHRVPIFSLCECAGTNTSPFILGSRGIVNPISWGTR